MFKSKTRSIIAAAALAVGVFGSAQAAQAGVGLPQKQGDGIGAPHVDPDIIAILKADNGRKAGGDPEYLVLRKAGQQE